MSGRKDALVLINVFNGNLILNKTNHRFEVMVLAYNRFYRQTIRVLPRRVDITDKTPDSINNFFSFVVVFTKFPLPFSEGKRKWKTSSSFFLRKKETK